MTQTFTINDDDGIPCPLRLHTCLYYNDNLAVRLILCDEEGHAQEPYATLSVNVPGSDVAADEFVLNHDVRPSFREALEEAGIIEPTGRTVSYGYVRDQPVYRLADKGRERARAAAEEGE